MTNTAKHSFTVEVDAFGLFLVHTPYGAVACHFEKQVTEVIKCIAKRGEPFKQPRNTIPLVTESFESFKERGGDIEVIKSKKRKQALTPTQVDAIDLEAIGL